MRRGWIALLLPACAIALVLALLPPFPQPQEYHRFADARSFFGVPHFLDVASNLAFLAVAVSGLFTLRSASFADGRERRFWGLFFLALTATSFGSAWYHLAPDDVRLLWDRLPINVCFAALLSAVIAERIGMRAGLVLLPLLLATGAGMTGYWLWSETRGIGNVLSYFGFQLYALLAILLLMRFPPRYTHGEYLYRVMLLYGAALAAELLDRHIYALGGVVSGHTLKHLIAALAAYQVVRMLRLRSACE